MLDIVLIQPPIRDFYLTAKRTFPCGLAAVAGALRAGGFSVEILDALASGKRRRIPAPPEMAHLDEYYGREDRSPFALFHGYRHFGSSFEHLGRAVRNLAPAAAAIGSLFTPYADEALRTAEAVKRFSPDTPVILGGHHPTALPQSVMECPSVDFVLRGEGEASLPALLRALRDGGNLDAVPGLVRRRRDGTLLVSEPASAAEASEVPAAVDLVDRSFYRRGGRPSVAVTASRGCPLSCSYCAVGKGSWQRHRRRPVSRVVGEILAALGNASAGFVDFEDENLSLDRVWFLDLLDALRDALRGRDVELRAMNGLLPTTLDEETVGWMRASGFRELNLSLGTTNPDQQRRFGRPDVSAAFDDCLAWAERYGLTAVGYLVAGAPDQRPGDSLDDLLYLAARRVLAGVSIYYPAPGSRDWDRCREKGILPERFSLMRSSALPLNDTTTRREAATLLRLGRILNFMKSLVDEGVDPFTLSPDREPDPACRRETGKILLAAFLEDGRIRGITGKGEAYEHSISQDLARKFVDRVRRIRLRGHHAPTR